MTGNEGERELGNNMQQKSQTDLEPGRGRDRGDF